MDNSIETVFIDNECRDTVLILPGGAYERTSPREGLPVAKAFQNRGYHTAVFHYRNNQLLYPELYFEARDLIDKFRRDRQINKLVICGFSAGGHFALMLLERHPEWFGAGILAYPVVSTDQKIWHQRSFENLIGKHISETILKEVSLENHVNNRMPPIFLWHTGSDESVPIQNSLLLYESLLKHKIMVDTCFYGKGSHGLSLAVASTAFDNCDPEEFARENRHVSSWFDRALEWLDSIRVNHQDI